MSCLECGFVWIGNVDDEEKGSTGNRGAGNVDLEKNVECKLAGEEDQQECATRDWSRERDAENDSEKAKELDWPCDEG